MKFCKDCKYLSHKISETYEGAFGTGALIDRKHTPVCTKEECLDVVYGNWCPCEQARQGACGQEGKFWEAK